ncbi:MAG: hypothetical protein FKY71_07115 [Spiribacter salinus]|uniref:Anti sigma-E protein RseA N-terminal domain-containing protein n=1 Tax=Spiribacter salinus TaxID=1335746 RepID=A0A540VTW8_9GAMM|nr:MAG: hypothetical protein FKY71_07805 [Spiribacter salinus]TQE99733.1 MAG: hypothetical protein FKY71_07115 [Spiribacter salinus]
MREQDFEQIMAYHDRALDGEQAAKVEQLLAGNTEAREFLARMREGDDFLRNGLGEVLEQPVPQRLVDTARGNPGAGRGKKVLAFPERSFVGRWAYATAASVALAVIAGTYMLADPSDVAHSDLLARVVSEGLEVTASGDIYRASGQPVQVMPMATFATADAGICRQYAARHQGEQSVGLACRQQESQWQIRAQQTLAADSQPQSYAPASGSEGQIADEIEALGGGRPLGIAKEETLMSNGWQR